MLKPVLFLSHDPVHRSEWISRFAKSLRSRGAEVFDPLDEESGHADFARRVSAAARSAQGLIALIEPAPALNGIVFFEMGVAVQSGKLVIPVVSPVLKHVRLPFASLYQKRLEQKSPDETAQEVLHSFVSALAKRPARGAIQASSDSKGARRGKRRLSPVTRLDSSISSNGSKSRLPKRKPSVA